jgi:hypothetical protein
VNTAHGADRGAEVIDMARASKWCVVAAAVLVGCGWKPAEPAGERGRKASMAGIANFDPDEDIHFDLEAYGTDRPDQYEIEQAFATRYAAFDECVIAEKRRRGRADQLPGEVAMAIKLNPKSNRPFAIHAELPAGADSRQLDDCLRDAAAAATYPQYDGPPVQVKFNFELDPGALPID